MGYRLGISCFGGSGKTESALFAQLEFSQIFCGLSVCATLLARQRHRRGGTMAMATAAASDGAWDGWSFATSLSVGGRDKQTGLAVEVFPLRAPSVSSDKNDVRNASSNPDGTEPGDGDGDGDGDGGGGGGPGGTAAAGDGGGDGDGVAMDVDVAADPAQQPREPLHQSGAGGNGRAWRYRGGVFFFILVLVKRVACGQDCSLCRG